MPQPLVSIVINNYNYGRYLEQAIRSALAQTYRDVELIVVDDGSTDQSREIIARYADRCDVLLKENGGQASAFNAGIRRSKGEYVLLLDSDDYLFPDAVERFLAAFPPGYARIYSDLRVIDEHGAPRQGVAKSNYFRPFDGDPFASVRTGGDFFWAPTSANFLHGDTLRAIGPVPEKEYRICADAYVLVQMALRGPVKSIPGELVAYRIHSSNNFATDSFSYSDARRLRSHLENHYRNRKLLVDACRVAGFEFQAEPDDENYFLVQCLCAGRAMKLQSYWLNHLDRLSLFGAIGRYLRKGKLPLPRRLAQSAYLALLVALPARASVALLQRVDDRRQQRAHRQPCAAGS